MQFENKIYKRAKKPEAMQEILENYIANC